MARPQSVFQDSRSPETGSDGGADAAQTGKLQNAISTDRSHSSSVDGNERHLQDSGTLATDQVAEKSATPEALQAAEPTTEAGPDGALQELGSATSARTGSHFIQRSILRWWLRLTQNRTTPAFLVSLILHTCLLLMLAIWTVAHVGDGGGDVGLVAIVADSGAEADAIEVTDAVMSSNEIGAESASSAAEALVPSTAVETISAGAMGADLKNLADEQGLDGGKRAPTTMSAAGELFSATASSINASLSTIDVSGRKPESRQRLALERGGSAESEAAVESALAWLAAHQRPNGSWSLVHTNEACDGSCSHPGSPERYDPAATGLALLAFLGAGYTHRDGKYAGEVKRGIYYLLQIMEETPRGGSFLYSSPQGMYNQGIASFALCEAYQLSRDESLRRPCQRAIEFIVNAQNDVGGWGYLPKRPGDLTITGWQTMALKSADGADIYIPAHTIVRIDTFLDSQTDNAKIFYGYGAPGKSTTCTAIGLLLRLFRNWPDSDPRILAGVSYLENQGISGHDIYRNYYGTLLLFHVGGNPFKQWNPRMRESLVNSQSRSGHAAGSWYFEDKFGEVGGRLYTTAMAAMTLEVYYRFSPIYLNSDRPFEF